MKLLTKSKYMLGLSCPGHLWMTFHDEDKLPEPDVAARHVIEQGNIIGRLAKKLFPEGVDLSELSKDFRLNLEKTQEALKDRKVIFEAGVISGELYARADVLVPVQDDEWDVVEVKGSSRVKPEHVDDLSFQKHVYRTAGIKIRKCFLLHVNPDYVKKGEIRPEEILKKEDVTEKVDETIEGIQDRIQGMLDIINLTEPPKVSVKNGCNNKLKCPCEDCWNFLPEEHVLELHRGGKKSTELLEAGILAIKNIPDDFKLNPKQKIQRECANTGRTQINKGAIKKFLKNLKHPVYYLDLESFQTAIPLYDGTKPYQQIPFQFSVHKDTGQDVRHFDFLHNSKEDPREKFLSEMKKAIGDEGSIIVFHKSFETARLKELGEAFPEYKEWTDNLISRMVDLIVPFRNFDYYNPVQKGSCSIKNVLPAVTGKSYKELNVNNGVLASVLYFRSIFDTVEDKDQTTKDLLEYCKMDTEGMVWIVQELEEAAKE